MKSYKKLEDFLISESTVFEKEEDTCPLFYVWAVLKSANGKTDEEIKKDQDLKALFKKIRKFCDENSKAVKKLKGQFSPGDLELSFKGQEPEAQKRSVEYTLDAMLSVMSRDIKSFSEWKDLSDAFKALRESEEMKTVIGAI